MDNSIGFFDVIWSIMLLFLLVAWFWVLISVVADIFQSKDLSGIAKALWIGFVIVIPWLGVLAYIIARGDRMQEHTLEAMAKVEDAQRNYIRQVVQNSPADELVKLTELKEKGVLSDAEFTEQKAKVLSA